MFKFLRNYPAMKIGNYLVAADLHLGITKDIYEHGIIIPLQAEKLAKRLNKIRRTSRTKNLVLLGDIKHKVTGFSIHEKYELERFFGLLDFKNIVVVKGNHDGDIEKMIPKNKNITVKKSFSIDGFMLTHGHRNVKTSKKNIVIGHNQPHVKFKDEMGAVYTEPVWVIGKLSGKLKGKTLFMVPAFNELCGATVVNRDKLLGPIARHLNKRSTHIFLLDGTDLGLLSDFEK